MSKEPPRQKEMKDCDSEMTTKSIVTGGAGFIGSTLVDALVTKGHRVCVIDNLKTGKRNFLNSKVDFIEADLSEPHTYEQVFAEADEVYHLAANADVRFGWSNPKRDLNQNLINTLNVVDLSVKYGVEDFIFTSTGSVYGDVSIFPTPENAFSSQQTSLYSASKISAEAFLGAYSSAEKVRVTILRFVSVLGPRYNHGHVYDFVKQLRNNPTKLEVLGDGFQTKAYMHVYDCVEAMLLLRARDQFDVFNVGQPEAISVRQSIQQILEVMGCDPKISFGKSNRGWVGDNPKILLDTSKALNMGWQARRKVQDSIRDTVLWLLNNSWILGESDEIRINQHV